MTESRRAHPCSVWASLPLQTLLGAYVRDLWGFLFLFLMLRVFDVGYRNGCLGRKWNSVHVATLPLVSGCPAVLRASAVSGQHVRGCSGRHLALATAWSPLSTFFFVPIVPWQGWTGRVGVALEPRLLLSGAFQRWQKLWWSHWCGQRWRKLWWSGWHRQGENVFTRFPLTSLLHSHFF